MIHRNVQDNSCWVGLLNALKGYKMNIEYDELVDVLSEEKTQEFHYENIEFKRSWDQEYGKKISAIGNRKLEGEYFEIIGIEDNGKISGFDEKWAKKTEKTISDHLNQYLAPSLTCLGVVVQEINNKYVIIIRCKNPGAVIRWNSKAYRANGTSLLILEPYEEIEISMHLPGLEDHSAQKHESLLANSLIIDAYNRAKEIRPELSHLNAKVQDDPLEYLNYLKINNTNSSYILFGNCRYRFIVYGSDNTVKQNIEIAGLYNLLKKDNYFNLVATINQTYGYKSITLAEKAVAEGFANAVMHAAYFENDGELMVEIYKDRIAISNLCYPESIAFANKWYSKSHKTYNRILGEYLRSLRHVDELGLGKYVIYRESLVRGNPPPDIIIENAGRLKRWKLRIFYLNQNSKQIDVLKKLKAQYKDESKAIMALSLVLWKDKKVEEIRNYIDDEYISIFAELIDDIKGPVFYYRDTDSLILNRWVDVLLNHGQESKAFTVHEKNFFYSFCYKMSKKYDAYIITPKDIRTFTHLGNSRSEQSQCSALFSEWEAEGKVVRVKKGIYKFVRNEELENQTENIVSALSKS